MTARAAELAPASSTQRQNLSRFKINVNADRLTGWVDDAQQWSLRRTAAQVKGLDSTNPSSGKDFVGLVGLGTWMAQVEFADVEVAPTCS
jgi:hypothetical protein